jgi:two-component system cell cycle sensor histidine kinase/response regulator CckA
MLRRLIGEDIELRTELGATLQRVKTDPGQLEQVLVNLVVNARDAMPQGGILTIRTENRELRSEEGNGAGEAGSFVGLVVSDTGIGMDPEVRVRIFEPFFTTKETGKGTGMGLSTVYGIVKQNGGRIWLESEPDQGTSFFVFFPRSTEPLTERAASPEPRARRGCETVLVVEDEDAVRSLTRMVLEGGGYRVLEAADAEEALQTFARTDGRLDLLLTDVVMPRMSGPHLAARLQHMKPDLKVLFISGHADETIVQHGVLIPDTELLVKPFSVKELLARVQGVLQDWRPEPPKTELLSDVRS